MQLTHVHTAFVSLEGSPGKTRLANIQGKTTKNNYCEFITHVPVRRGLDGCCCRWPTPAPPSSTPSFSSPPAPSRCRYFPDSSSLHIEVLSVCAQGATQIWSMSEHEHERKTSDGELDWTGSSSSSESGPKTPGSFYKACMDQTTQLIVVVVVAYTDCFGSTPTGV